MTTDSDVEDYGTSDFKGRPLDTAFARVKIRLKNPILGEYKDPCFVFGRIVDPEFNMTRDLSSPPATKKARSSSGKWDMVSRADGSSANNQLFHRQARPQIRGRPLPLRRRPVPALGRRMRRSQRHRPGPSSKSRRTRPRRTISNCRPRGSCRRT